MSFTQAKIMRLLSVKDNVARSLQETLGRLLSNCHAGPRSLRFSPLGTILVDSQRSLLTSVEMARICLNAYQARRGCEEAIAGTQTGLYRFVKSRVAAILGLKIRCQSTTVQSDSEFHRLDIAIRARYGEATRRPSSATTSHT